MGVRIAGSESGRQAAAASVEAASSIPETLGDVSAERTLDGGSADQPRRARHRRRRNARRRRVILAVVAVCAVAAFAVWGRSRPIQGLVPAAVVALVGILLLGVMQLTNSRRSAAGRVQVTSRKDDVQAQHEDVSEPQVSQPAAPFEGHDVVGASPMLLEAGPAEVAPAQPEQRELGPVRGRTVAAQVEQPATDQPEEPAEAVPATNGQSQPAWMAPIVESSPEIPDEAFREQLPQLMALRAGSSHRLEPLEDMDVRVDMEVAVRGQSDELAEVGDLLVSLHRRFGVMYRSRTWVEEILPACAIGTMDPELTRDLLAAAVLGAGGVEVDREAFSLLHDEATVESTISHLYMALIEFEARLSRGAMPVTLS